jgi:hypothetical protein
LTARLAFTRDFSPAEQEMGAIVLDALFKELGLPGVSAWGGTGLEHDELPQALEAALEKPDADVRAAAARAYEAMFHAPAPRFARKTL